MSWEVLLGNSVDLSHIADITEQCSDKSLTLALNRPGTFNFTIPLFTEYYEDLDPAKNCIILVKNDNIVWSGPLWTKSESFATRKITMSAAGWFQFLNKRFITDSDHTYGPINQGDLAFTLLALANAQTIDAIARPTGITAGSNSSSVSITSRTYNKWQNIGAEIIALSDIESGFDFFVDPETKEMNIRNWDDVDESTALFAFDFGPDNLLEVTREVNADDLVNQEYVAGQYGTAEAHETPSVDDYNLHQKVDNINEISDSQTLGAIANAEIAVNGYPRVNLSFDPKGDSQAVPSLFEEYQLGDIVHLTAKAPNAEINNQAVRLFGLTVNIDNNDNEKISSIQTVFSA